MIIENLVFIHANSSTYETFVRKWRSHTAELRLKWEAVKSLRNPLIKFGHFNKIHKGVLG